MNFTGYKTTARLFGALLLATGTFISTQQASHAQAQQFGIVNFRRCAQESKMKVELDAKFAEISKQLLSVFQKMKDANAVFLDANEIKELAALYEKLQPSDADKKRIEALVGRAGSSLASAAASTSIPQASSNKDNKSAAPSSTADGTLKSPTL